MGKKLGQIQLTEPSLFYRSFRDYFYRRRQNFSSWVFDCMDLWGKHFAKVNFRLYRNTDDDGNYSEVRRHPILDMFNKPNDFQSWWEIKYRIAQHFALYGNSYFLKLRDRMGVPRSIVQLQPGRVEPISSRMQYISHYEYYIAPPHSLPEGEGGSVKLNKGDVIHLRYPDPDNLIKGRAIISNILDQNEVDILQTAYQKKFYKEGGFLGLTFTTEQELSEPAFQRAKQELMNQYGGGAANSFKVALFEQGLKPIKAAYSIRDMDIKTQRELTRDEICAAFQVSQFLLGLGELINRATAETALFQFSHGVIDPLMTYVDDVFTKDLAQKDFDEDLFIQHDRAALADVETDLKYYENGLRNGWLTVEEVREWENLKPIRATD